MERAVVLPSPVWAGHQCGEVEDPHGDEVVAHCHTLMTPGGGTCSAQLEDTNSLPGRTPLLSLPLLQGYKQQRQRLANSETSETKFRT